MTNNTKRRTDNQTSRIFAGTKRLMKGKRLFTGLLACTNIGIMSFYTFCDTACRYLKGDILGIDLKYAGIFFMSLILFFLFLNKKTPVLALLSLGVGAESFLIGYQIAAGVYCLFCLAFGIILAIMFAINCERKKIHLMAISALVGLAFFFLAFNGSTTPAFAGENGITSFGSGPIQVRLYTDYFCGPCRAAEAEMELQLINLLEKNTISLTLIDTPVHKYTSLYARYFLYILNESQRFFPQAMQARHVLFEAAGQNIHKPELLEAFLGKKNYKLKPFDVKPVFRSFDAQLKADKITSTPSCVIIGPRGKEVFVGGANIIKALKSIQETS